MTPEIPNYTLLKPLGEGAMAQVWLAEHKRNGRKAAIKILKSSALADVTLEKLFLREGQVLAGFDHPNIVKIYDNDRSGDNAYLVMECLSGGTLLERMQRAPITIGEAIGLVVQIASALNAAHSLKVIHRDLKPANIMLRDETTPVLTDFGVSRVLDRSTIYGRDDMIVGTPLYMSPEQISAQRLSGASDLYALGIMFFELLTGARPFPGTSFPEIAAQHLHAPIPRLPAAISMLQPVLDRMLAKEPGQRYASAQNFIDDLRATFVNDEALRLQVGYSGTSLAWSSQLRALGFVLDGDQKAEVRSAQGAFLRETAAIPRTAAGILAAPLAQPASLHPQADASSRMAAFVLIAFVLLMVVVGAAWWWTRGGPVATQLPDAPAPVGSGAAPEAQSADQSLASVSASSSAESKPASRSDSDDVAGALRAAQAAVAALELRNRYSLVAGNRVSDSSTGLNWAAADNGEDVDWTDARTYCAGMGADWMLPSASELLSLYDATGTLTSACGDTECKVSPLIRLSASAHWTRENADRLHQWVLKLSDGTRKSMGSVNPFGNRALCVRKP